MPDSYYYPTALPASSPAGRARNSESLSNPNFRASVPVRPRASGPVSFRVAARVAGRSRGTARGAIRRALLDGYAPVLLPSFRRFDSMRTWGSRYARMVLERCDNNKRQACRELGISYDIGWGGGEGNRVESLGNWRGRLLGGRSQWERS